MRARMRARDPQPTSRASAICAAANASVLACGISDTLASAEIGGRVRRREFITLLNGAAVGWSLGASAQTRPKIPRVGVVQSATPGRGLEGFRQGLRELGYVEAQTIVLEVRWAEGR